MHDEQRTPVSPPALRLRRPGLRDPRLLLGLALVAAAVMAGSALVSSASHTVPVYVAVAPIVTGDPVGPEALGVRDVRLPGDAGVYLRADEELPVDLIAVREVGAGELVPRSAVADAPQLSVRPVAVSPRGALPSGLAKGSVVDLWFVPDGVGDASSGPWPAELATGLTVAEVSTSGGGLQIGSGVTVHVLVPVGDLADVLAALVADGSVEIVHVVGSTR